MELFATCQKWGLKGHQKSSNEIQIANKLIAFQFFSEQDNALLHLFCSKVIDYYMDIKVFPSHLWNGLSVDGKKWDLFRYFAFVSLKI